MLVDRRAVIRGTLLVSQQEPVLTLGIDPGQIEAFVHGFVGYDLAEPVAAGAPMLALAGSAASWASSSRRASGTQFNTGSGALEKNNYY